MKPCYPGRRHRHSEGPPPFPVTPTMTIMDKTSVFQNLSGMNFQAVRSDRSSQGEAAGYLDAAATASDLLA
jgi:hypothetical protein